MLDLETLAALRLLFWLIFVPVLGFAAWRFVRDETRPVAMGRSAAALALASVAMLVLEMNGGAIGPWAQFGIDLAVLAVVTMPPKSFWQATLGGLLLVQLALHAIWGFVPTLALEHYLGTLLVEFPKCAILALWAGGARVETVLDRIGGWSANLVLAARSGKLAR